VSLRWVFDLDGVVWLSGKPIAGAAEALAQLRSEGHSLTLVTNNSTPALGDHLRKLAQAGVAAEREEVVTSSQAAAFLVGPGRRAAVVGGPGVAEALEDVGATLVDPGEDPDAVVVGRCLELDFKQLSDAAAAIRAGARFVATNLDATFPTPHGLEPGAGALVAYLETASGRKAELAGKPAPAMARLVRERNGTPDLVVGDRPDTDGMFAQALGADFVLVLSGITTKDDLPVTPTPRLVAEDLAQAVSALLGDRGHQP